MDINNTRDDAEKVRKFAPFGDLVDPNVSDSWAMILEVRPQKNK